MEPTVTPSTTTEGEPAGVVPVLRGPVVSTPETCGGKPGIAGGRIRVKHVAVMHRRRGMGPEATVPEYPHLSPAAVHAALAYGHDRRDARDAEIEAERAWYEAVMQDEHFPPPADDPKGRLDGATHRLLPVRPLVLGHDRDALIIS